MAKKRQQQAYKATKNTKKSGNYLRMLTALLPSLSAPAQPYWRYLPWLLLAAFVLRAAVSLAGDFVIHPDEIMQYLEPAHGLVFGNNVTYWEFYFGARSWLVPSVVAGVMFLCKFIGLDSPTFYIAAVKLFFCLLSLAIPLGLYIIGRRMFGEMTARVALVLAVFWYELIGFAHKPMTEFVATALLLGLMVYALRPEKLNKQQAIIASCLAVFVVAVRFQYGPLVGLVLLVPFLRADMQVRGLMVLASFAAVAVIGVFEYATWGSFLHSYHLNFRANVVLNAYRADESSGWLYIGWVIVASGGLFLLAAAAMLNYQRRLFLLLLTVVLLLLHITQVHREYRFVFVLIPLWLLLFADFLVIGWEQQRENVKQALARRWRIIVGLAYAAVVSVAGIANALPLQDWVYRAYSQETGYVHFLREQDEVFALYRQLAADDSVRGLHDTTRSYFNTGGYYYLHKAVPFYDAGTGGSSYPHNEAQNYVSHIITNPPVTPTGLVQTAGGGLAMQTESGTLYRVPGYISDMTLNKLVYWDKSGNSSIVEGFSLQQSSAQYAVWATDGSTPVREWNSYKISPDSSAMYQVVKKAGFGELTAAIKFGIEYVDN